MIRVDVLGGLRVSDAVREHPELQHQPMRAALLVMLAVDRAIPRDRVLATLWPDRNAERGRRALNQTVYELRRVLGDEAIVAAGETLSAGSGVQCDVHDFEQALARGDVAGAVACYGGPFLSGFFLAPTNAFEDWTTRHQARLGRAARRARLQRISELEAAGDRPEALLLAQRAVGEDPLEDEYQHALIQLLVTTGERAAALRQYESYRHRLLEHGLRPLEQTTDLIAGIRESDPVAAPATSAPVAPVAPVAPAAPVARPVPSASTSPPAADGHFRAPPRWRRAVGAAVAGVAVVALAFVAVQRLREAGGVESSADVRPQVAVYFLGDASPAGDHAYLARGISERLVHELQQRVPRVRVLAVDPGRAPAEDGAADGSAGLRVDGSLAVDADSVRVRVRLSDGGTGELLRPVEVRFPRTTELALIDSVVPAVVEQLQPALGDPVRRRELRAGTRSAEAFALYLRASEALEARRPIAFVGDRPAEERLLASVDSLLELADRADPKWSRTATLRARVAQRRALLVILYAGGPASPPARAFFATALRHADDAVARNPRDADALTGRANVRLAVAHLGAEPQTAEQRRALDEGAERDLHRAVAADPLRAEAWLFLARTRSADGDWQRARAAALQAYRTDGFLRHRAPVLAELANSAFQLGRDDEAQRWCYQGAAEFPDSNLWWDCRSHLFAYRRPPAADSALALVDEAATRPRAEGILGVVELNAAYALAAAGQRQAALRRLAETRRLEPGRPDLRPLEAAVTAAIGDTASAIRLLQAYVRDVPDPTASLAGRPLHGLRDHPGFPQARPETR